MEEGSRERRRGRNGRGREEKGGEERGGEGRGGEGRGGEGRGGEDGERRGKGEERGQVAQSIVFCKLFV